MGPIFPTICATEGGAVLNSRSTSDFMVRIAGCPAVCLGADVMFSSCISGEKSFSVSGNGFLISSFAGGS